MLVLLCCFVVYSTRRFVLNLALCYFALEFFSPFSIANTSHGEERTKLSAFRTFVRFALVWFCPFPLPLGVCMGRAAASDCGTPWIFLTFLLFHWSMAITLTTSLREFGVYVYFGSIVKNRPKNCGILKNKTLKTVGSYISLLSLLFYGETSGNTSHGLVNVMCAIEKERH